MAGLLVSVRSAAEARDAFAGGASVIDVKEPIRGALGRADPDVWNSVRAAIPASTAISVALGEIAEWDGCDVALDWDGIRYRKLGLAGSGETWRRRWQVLEGRLGSGPDWIAVAYLDWEAASAPAPDAVLDFAISSGCAGVLFDTSLKGTRPRLDPHLMSDRLARARENGLLTALAGGLDETLIRALAPLQPDLFAVRGAACLGGDRNASIDPRRVQVLVRAARSGPDASQGPWE